MPPAHSETRLNWVIWSILHHILDVRDQQHAVSRSIHLKLICSDDFYF